MHRLPRVISQHVDHVCSAALGKSVRTKLIFEVRDVGEEGFIARALEHSLFTEADSWDELRSNVLDAIAFRFNSRRH